MVFPFQPMPLGRRAAPFDHPEWVFDCPTRRPRASARPAVRILRAPAARKTLYLPLVLVPNREICFRFRRASTRKISCHRFLEMNNLILGPSRIAFRYRKDVG